MGWAAGVGLADYLDTLKTNLAKRNVEHTDDIIKVYKETFQSNASSKRLKSDSVLAFSWLGFTQNQLLFRIGYLGEKDFGNNIAITKNNIFNYLHPYEYVVDQTKVENFFNKFEDKYDFDGDLNSLLKKLLERFNYFAKDKDVKSIDDICDIGIQLFTNDGIVKIRIKEQVDILLKAIDEGDVSNYFKLIDVITLSN
ncbi:hypothetical protein FH966_02670 [Lentibacillus cibarius]|uniref:Uncharacterized protein n=1 Tax=Lentibacillus cibarius TaxID=2583219 RepID=A0A549YFQ7_9BACI|nr:hypothetical protein [Lentibacillus cibarius]TRM10705.1 hypothetical protein FH966_02670 [Lentibacillus cibarius]